MFGRMETAPNGWWNTRRGLTHRIDYTDWRADMDSTHAQPKDIRANTERWNRVPVPERVAQRAITNMDVDANGCWISRYSTSTHGYAQVGWSIGGGKNHMVLAHRAAWTAVHGQVPLGMTLDHTCKVRRCVNPDHMRLLSNFENARRSRGMEWPVGECANGHSSEHLRPVTQTTKSGGRRSGLGCALCYRLYGARERWRQRNPGAPMPATFSLPLNERKSPDGRE